MDTEEKELYVKEIIRSVKLQAHCMEQAGRKIDSSFKLENMEVCGSLADFLRGDKKRFRTPVDLPKGNYSDIDLVLTFNKPDMETSDILAKAEARNCPCVYMSRIGAHELVWNLPSRAPSKDRIKI